jgi:hypothetical protein
MSEENVEVVRRLFTGPVDFVQALDPDGFETTRAAMEPLVHPDFETVTVPGQVPVPGAGGDPSQPIACGLDGFARTFRDWQRLGYLGGNRTRLHRRGSEPSARPVRRAGTLQDTPGRDAD